jgi:hypothetical protein
MHCRTLVLIVVLVLAPTATARAQPEPPALTEAVVIEREAAVEVWVRLSRAVKYRSDLMDSPWRLVLDFEGTAYRWAPRPVAVGLDPVRELRGSQYRPGIARLVVELRRKATYTIEQDREGLRIVLPREGAARAAPAAPARPATSAAPPAAPARPTARPAAPVKAPAPAGAPPRAVLAGPRVHGIIVLDEEAHAYIFDPATRQVRRYATGDRLGDAVVERIGERHVVLRTPAGRVELRVEEAPRPR